MSGPAAPAPGVLMVTGAYAPEVTGASRQCRALVQALAGEARFRVLTTTRDPDLPASALVDGVPVQRVRLRPERTTGLVGAGRQLAAALLALPVDFRVVHLHGFSRKSVLLVALARIRRRRILVKLTSVGEDDPLSVRRRGGLAWLAYRHADAFVGVSSALGSSYRDAGLPPARFRLIPNGVDTHRFRPADPDRRAALRRELALPDAARVVLFVGHFSRDKRPDWLLEAWAALPDSVRCGTALILVGATRPGPHDVDTALAERVRLRAERFGGSVRFVESTPDIEGYYQACDAFALTSVREGLPNALLEAMACGLPCVATRLAGVTDDVVRDGHDGRLVPADDLAAFTAALEQVVCSGEAAREMGRHAVATARNRFSLADTARQHLALYQELSA